MALAVYEGHTFFSSLIKYPEALKQALDSFIEQLGGEVDEDSLSKARVREIKSLKSRLLKILTMPTNDLFRSKEKEDINC